LKSLYKTSFCLPRGAFSAKPLFWQKARVYCCADYLSRAQSIFHLRSASFTCAEHLFLAQSIFSLI
jgi:hypothetical protein